MLSNLMKVHQAKQSARKERQGNTFVMSFPVFSAFQCFCQFGQSYNYHGLPRFAHASGTS